MTRIAYTIDNAPAVGTGAFMPAPARTGTSATAGIMRRFLSMTRSAPDPQLEGYAPGPCADTTGQAGFNPSGSYAQPPAAVPLAFARQQDASSWSKYWVSNYANGEQQMGPNGAFTNMKIFSDNPLPMPASDWVRSAAPAMRQPPWATIVTTPWPRPFVNWPTWGSSRSS